MSRPLDPFDSPEASRCHCGAVEPQPGDFAECIGVGRRECNEVICPTCQQDDDLPRCERCDEFANELGYMRSCQREMGEGGIAVGEAYRQEQARRLK